MKNLTKTLSIAIVFFAIACQKEETYTPVTPSVTPPKDTTKTIVVSVPTPAPSTTVLYSDWLSPNTSPTNGGNTGNGNNGGTVTGTGSGSSIKTVQTFDVNAPAITQEILDKGVVLAYCRLNGDDKTRALATTTTISGFLSIWDFALSKGKIQFIQSTANPFGIPAISSSHKFRYVIIPPTKHVRLSKPWNKMSYEEVCSILDIPL